MKTGGRKLVAIAVIVAEVASAAMTAAPASAQDAAQQRRTIAQQQRVILQQQQQILENQRQLQQQQRQLASTGRPDAPPADLNRGIFGNIGGCPPGYTYNLINGCLPTVVVLH